jgi:hypothetical protein
MPIDQAAPYAHALRSTTLDVAPWLAALPHAVIAWRPAPTAWSIREIIGHLVDSAANNHQRFVRAEQQTDLVFSGYDQEHWVRAQAYDAAPWAELVTLWAAYNQHLARIMATVPPRVRERRHERHNLHQVGWRPFAADTPATLDDLMHDYVLHLDHHLAQVRDRVRGAEAALSAHA